ncbi:MAG: restriction endonuclease [Desulfurivibrio sp.]|nr:restriction endonuclease [Desulfurivibrio sp.]MBU3954324.1 restriction endonuclease [Pseudomonadota bacterium]MBU4119669.1 restriction endonuclease [Pseudomonadota bacterium]
MTDSKQTLGRENFYKLMPSEFERLVADLFAQAGYSDVKLVGGPGDQGVDILAAKDNQPFAIQVKHKTKFSLREVQQFTDLYFSNPSTPRNLIFVTSAELPPDAAQQIEHIPEGASFEIMDHHGLQEMVQSHKAASEQVMEAAIQREKSQKKRLILSSIGSFLSIVSLFVSILYVVFPSKAPLDKRIETVEKALGSMHDLESYLNDIKRDMEETQKATTVIKQKYDEAKELEKLTAAQIAALQSTLQGQNWRWTVLNYLLGFVFGVASSLVASVLHARWQQRKALT